MFLLVIQNIMFLHDFAPVKVFTISANALPLLFVTSL